MNTQTENLVWVGEGINCRALTFFQATNLGEHQVSRKSPRTQWPLLVDFFRIHKTAARRSEGFLKGFTRTGKARVELLYLTRSYGSVGLHVIQRRLAAFPFFFYLAIQMWKPDHFIFLAWIQLTLALTEFYYHSGEAVIPRLCFIIVSLRKRMKFKFSLTKKIKYYRIWL